ncbi:hypothetical protein [Pseudomonas purpurea]|uniref:hypothetical protein n=1 Tax=Pseudomonas purpurea TaxID=3136737 RepID=UPI0032641D27
MPSPEFKLSSALPARLVRDDAPHQAERTPREKPCGAPGIEHRISELETHLKHLRSDMDEVCSDLKSIKHRNAYSTGAAVVIIGVAGWIANSRFDQLVQLLTR